MKDIKGYEGLYAITSCGKVWSYRAQKFLKPVKDKDGYLCVNLTVKRKAKHCAIHRLVAEAYIPNPENKTDINHIDENKEHNYISNLEWISHKDNCNHGTRNKRIAEKNSIPIYCEELDKVFPSAHEVERQLGIDNSHISMCCRGKRKTCGGYHWRYAL